MSKMEAATKQVTEPYGSDYSLLSIVSMLLSRIYCYEEDEERKRFAQFKADVEHRWPEDHIAINVSRVLWLYELYSQGEPVWSMFLVEPETGGEYI